MSATQPTLTDLIDLRGKRALVTGATKGIGAATARRLAEAGAHVTVADLDPNGRSTSDALVADGLSASYVTCDITDAEQLRDAVAAAADGERLDVLVNNAGIFPTTGPIDDVTDAFVSRMLDVNLRAQYSASRDAARLMTHGGAIVNIASIAGIRGGANITAYSASKAGVMGLTRAFANELGPRGIRVNAIAPGLVETRFASALTSNAEISKMVIDRTALKRFAQPDDIAGAAVFLASDESRYVTGQTLAVDGGWTIT